MAYLHRNSEMLKSAITIVSNELKITPSTIEKDYYVTMILRELSEEFPDIVFKGGTSLSKCYHAIKRFSEDIDITTQESLSQSKKTC